MRKTVVLAVAVMILSTVSAFPASLEVNERTATPDKEAEFSVNFENNFGEERRFRISSISSSPSHWFSIGDTKTVPNGQNGSISFEVSPPEKTIQQNYLFEVAVRSGEDVEKLRDYFRFTRDYDLVLESFELDKTTVNPGETVEGRVEVLNTAGREISDYRIEVNYMDRSLNVTGDPVESAEVEDTDFSFEVPENVPPSEEEVEASITRGGESFSTTSTSFRIREIKNLTRSVKVDNSLLVYSKQIEVTNRGNSDLETTVNQSLPDYLGPIIEFSEEPETTDMGTTEVHSWVFSLEPGESASVSYKVSYWMPVTVLLALIAGFVAVKRLRTDIKFEKTTKVTEDAVKVRIEVSNMSSRSVKDVKIKDFVPDIASLKEEFEMAKPIIRRTSDGTRLEWDIEELETGDQRVMEYQIKPKVEVEEEVQLPSAEMEVEGERIAQTDKPSASFRPEQV